ncbi:MAG TPA: glycerate kinase [Candidatus Acidoferrum sp.]|nr:glycerate kinase [Candidatus Acidoferrum sp.]
MKVVLVPDSFKGCASSSEVCGYMKSGVLAACPDAEVIAIPVADGGEGTVDAVLAATGGKRVTAAVQSPLGEPVTASYAVVGDTAVIEVAQAAGLALARGRVGEASTYGVGQLIADAFHRGAKRVTLGLGGSGTNDGGCGMAAALGARFYNKEGQTFIPTGDTLKDIARIELSPPLPLEAMCDVDNPLCGPAGAAHVYGPQKGAKDPAALDEGLRHLASLLPADAELPGAGAAGGLGFGVAALLGGTLRSGIDAMLDLARFEESAKGADLILTGEGRMDGQTARGKVPVGVARRAKSFRIPVVALCGALAPGYEAVYGEGVTAVFSACRGPQSLEEAISGAPAGITAVTADIVRLLVDKGDQKEI